MVKSIRRKYLDFEGLCQLTWVGRILTVPGPKDNIVVRAYFTKVEPSESDGNRFERRGKAFWRDIPIGDIIDIPIGTFFFEGLPQALNKDNESILAVRNSIIALNFQDDNIKLIDRWHCDTPGTLLLPRAPGSLPEDPDYNGTLLCIGASGDPYAYMIPSYEVFRFFYAVSSRMAQVFLDSRFLEWGRYIWDPKRSAIDLEKKEARLWLRQWMLDQDAWFIATLAFDPIALDRAMNLYRSIAIDKSRVLRAVPPMHEWTLLNSQWIKVKNSRGTDTKVILRIISADWHPPFNTIKFDRDNDGRKGGRENNGVKELLNRPSTYAPTTKLPDTGDDPFDLTDLPSDLESTLQTIPLEEINHRFEWLTTASIEKLPQIDTEYEGDRYRAMQYVRWTTELSTIDGVTSAVAVQAVALTAADMHVLASFESHGDALEEPSEQHHTPNNHILNIAKGLTNIRDKTDATVTFLTLWDKTIQIETFTLFKLPKKIKDEALSWLYKSGSKNTRYALAARIRRPTANGEHETRYLLDFEPKQKNSYIVIVWTDSDRDLSDDDLRHLIRGFAKAKSVMVNQTRMWDVRMGRRRHTIPAIDIDNGLGFLQRIFETPAKN